MCLGLGNGCVAPKEEKTTSLLKKKTNNNRINEMSVDEKAVFLEMLVSCCSNSACKICPLSVYPNCNADSIKQWLASEATRESEGG